MTDYDENWALETLAVRAGQVRTPEGEHAEPIFTTSSYVFGSAAEAAARFKGEAPGNIYSRFTNPTVRTFEQRLAAMEGGECCVATASGMSAILSTCLGLLQKGDHIVSSKAIFGSTVVLFDKYLSKAGIETSYVPLTDLGAWQQAIKSNTRLLFLETPSNPLTEVADIRALAQLAREHDCLLVVDNCFCTPALQQPLKLGADIVIHSATKYIDGQGRCIGGAVVGDSKLVNIRMQAHSQNALHLANFLEQHAGVERVFYPGLQSHPQHQLASQQQSAYGGVVAFEVAGGQEAAWKLIDNTRLLSITANLGDTKSTITHPATTTHGRLSDEQRAEAGITPGLVRIAVGLENVNDIIADLERGLA